MNSSYHRRVAFPKILGNSTSRQLHNTRPVVVIPVGSTEQHGPHLPLDTDTRIAEFIREAALEGVSEELPHSIAVVIDEMKLREGRPEDKPLMDVFASIVVERESQKGIIIGHRGERLKQVGQEARLQAKQLLGMPVHLSLHVKVLSDWQRDPKHLNRLGF